MSSCEINSSKTHFGSYSTHGTPECTSADPALAGPITPASPGFRPPFGVIEVAARRLQFFRPGYPGLASREAVTRLHASRQTRDLCHPNIVALLETDSAGIYCPPGDFHIDPWGEAARAIITHAHSGHAHSGSRDYLTMRAGEALLRARIGSGPIHTVEYGERVTINGVTVSLHPAGHMLGAAQVRVEYRGEIWVVSGDYTL